MKNKILYHDRKFDTKIYKDMILYYMMETKQCLVCGKTIEGFTSKDVEYKMLMHQMKHRVKKEEQEVEEENELLRKENGDERTRCFQK